MLPESIRDLTLGEWLAVLASVPGLLILWGGAIKFIVWMFAGVVK